MYFFSIVFFTKTSLHFVVQIFIFIFHIVSLCSAMRLGKLWWTDGYIVNCDVSIVDRKLWWIHKRDISLLIEIFTSLRFVQRCNFKYIVSLHFVVKKGASPSFSNDSRVAEEPEFDSEVKRKLFKKAEFGYKSSIRYSKSQISIFGYSLSEHPTVVG